METVACPECDLLQRLPELPPGGKAKCSRCGNTVAARPSASTDRALALTVTAAIVFILAHTTSLMGLSAVGRSSSTTIFGGVLQMWEDGERITAVIVMFCAGIAPGAYLAFMLTVLLAVRRPPAPLWVGELMRWGHYMHPWSMNEVMILGILVALIKIAELATVECRHRDVRDGRPGRALSRHRALDRRARSVGAYRVGRWPGTAPVP